MDTRDGRIYSPKDQEGFDRMMKNKFMKPMAIPPTEKQLARKPPKVGRNEPCPCGSGKKFKRCCLNPPPKNLRRVEVFRMGDWREIRLVNIKKGERFRMWERNGNPVIDNQGQREWVAKTNGFVSGLGVGTVETE